MNTQAPIDNSISFDAWIKATVRMIHEHVYRVTPVYSCGATMPYSDKQTYPNPTASVWRTAEAVAVVLDDAILVDYDGNKPKPGIPSVDELASILGLEMMPDPVRNLSTSNGQLFKS